ncbi:ABC transporter permease [Clostridia bacterium]|nr:ABC transporter permease [Clostridia bacterium]
MMQTVINFFYASVKSGAPLLLGTTGEIVIEKSGTLNLGVEGMMSLGAFVGFFTAFHTDSITIGILAAALAGALAGLLFAFLTVSLQANQNVVGLTLTIFGSGTALYFGEMFKKTNPMLSEEMNSRLANVKIPLLGDIPVIGSVLFNQNILVYLAVIIAVAAGIYLKHTRTGLLTRAVGENPAAADSSGVSVAAYRYANLLVGGAVCGIGGAYLSLINSFGDFNLSAVSGQGWISVALVIFAGWSPFIALLGSLTFGAFYILQIRVSDLAAVFPALKFLTGFPSAFYSALPYLITAVVLIISSVRKKRNGGAPKGCGINYYREER